MDAHTEFARSPHATPINEVRVRQTYDEPPQIEVQLWSGGVIAQTIIRPLKPGESLAFNLRTGSISGTVRITDPDAIAKIKSSTHLPYSMGANLKEENES